MLLRAAFEVWRGFPLGAGPGLAWCAVPRAGTDPRLERLSESWLREAATALRVLPPRFPRVLRQLVGDVDAWQRGCVATLRALRGALDGNASLPALPPSVPAAAVADLPEHVATALAWTFAFDPLGLKAALGASAELRAATRAAGSFLDDPAAQGRLLQWVEMLASTGRGAASIWSLWATPTAWQSPVESRDAEPRGLATLVFDALPAAAALSASTRRALLETVGVLATPGVAARLDSWRVTAAAAGPQRPGRFPLPQPLRRPALWHRFLAWCAGFTPSTLLAMADVLRQVPEELGGKLVRLELALTWEEADSAGPHERRFRAWLQALARYLRSAADPVGALWPWYPLLQRKRRGRWAWTPCELWLSCAASGRRVAPAHCLAVLRRLSGSEVLRLHRRDWRPFDRVLAICAHVADPAAAATFAGTLQTALRQPSTPRAVFDQPLWKLVPCALRLAGGDALLFSRLVLRLAQDDAFIDICCSDGWGAVPSLPGAAGWVGELLCSGSAADAAAIRRLLRLALHGPAAAAVFEAADDSLRLEGGAPGAWPADVERRLRDLELSSPAAWSAAKALRDDLLPDPEALRTELAAVEKLLDTATEPKRSHLAHRRATLSARLDGAFVPSASIVNRWLRRVEHRAHHLRLTAWIEALARPRQLAAEHNLGCALPAAWWEDPAIGRVLEDLGRLKREFRLLAGRILADRAAGAWRGHLADARNQAWIDRQRAAGLDLDAWQRGPTPFPIETPPHAGASFAIATDPLDVLRCGAWFVTCLQPGGLNFFSTVVLAADANKHVLVLRTASGSVLGRCVFAIDRERRLRAFEPYCHDPSLDFAAVVDRIGREWAAAVGTGWPGAAPIEVLTASHWYDDGNARLHAQMDAMLDAPDVEARLRTGPDTGLVDLLQHRFGPDLLQSALARFALETRCVAQSPRLAGPLLAQCALPRDLDPWDLRHLLEMALASGHRAALARLAEHAAGAGLRGPVVAKAWMQLDEPARALRGLGAKWRKRGWTTDGDALLVAAMAHDQLFRRRRALELYASALRHLAPDSEPYALARAHRDRLAAELGAG